MPLLLPLLLICSQFGLAADFVQMGKIDKIFTAAGWRIVFEGGYGVTDLHLLRKIDTHTNFRLASVSKQFTAMALMLLVHDGKLHYDDRLTDIFSDFADYGRSISIRNLLNHTSGLEDYEDLLAAQYPSTPEKRIPQIKDGDVLELLHKCKGTKFVPGSKWQYSNSGYVLLAMIVERVSGRAFGKFLHDRIFASLKMQNTIAYENSKNRVENCAYGHSKNGEGWDETDQSPTSAALGDAGAYSSIEDLVKWDRALWRHTPLLSEREMQPALTRVKVSEGTEPAGTPADYGFGWFSDSYKRQSRMWHYGETIGFRTTTQRFVNDRLTIVVLCNRADLNPGIVRFGSG